MKTHEYDKKLNGEVHRCQVCGFHGIGEGGAGINVQHHIGLRRYDDRCIWVCIKCHTRIHMNPEWAYKKGYLVKRHQSMAKKKKKKSCKHEVTYFNAQQDDYICQYCGKKIGELRMGSSKKKR